MPPARLIAVAAGLLAAAAATAPPQKKLTAYRITPIEDEGVMNMNTADAAGDVYFGLSQLLLPYLCANGDNMLWCANRKWLSAGSAWMVYRKFTVEARLPFGEYQPCNPDPTTGIFSCSLHGGGNSWPKVCEGYHQHHSHYMNGTVYDTVALPSVGGSVADCCTKCDADQTCGAWLLRNASGPTNDAATASNCALLRDAIEVDNPDGIISGVKEDGPAGDNSCWYDEPAMKAGFASFCDPKNCSCIVADKMAVGLEAHAMCRNESGSHGFGGVYDSWISGLACLMDGNWYSTDEAGQCKPDGSNADSCWWTLKSPLKGERQVNASCADTRVLEALKTKNPSCWDACGDQADK
jgi:hypothetical protein|eukprot:COSAG01_NODE_9095_length_2557_cov_6.552075_1_plen_352_part_00